MLGEVATRRNNYYSDVSSYRSRRDLPGPAQKRLKIFPILSISLIVAIIAELFFFLKTPQKTEAMMVQTIPLTEEAKLTLFQPMSYPPLAMEPVAESKLFQPVPKQPMMKLPTGQLLVVNKNTFTLSLYQDGKKEETYTVGLGKEKSQTPSGKFKVISRMENPILHADGDQPEIPGGDPKNPLGPRWLGLNTGLNKPNSVGIHGTSEGAGVGRPQTEGCVQLDNQIIRKVYDKVSLGTPVWIGTSEELKEWGVEE